MKRDLTVLKLFAANLLFGIGLLVVGLVVSGGIGLVVLLIVAFAFAPNVPDNYRVFGWIVLIAAVGLVCLLVGGLLKEKL